MEERGHAEVDQRRDAALIFELLRGRDGERTGVRDVGEGGRCEGEQEQEMEEECRGGWRRHDTDTFTRGVVVRLLKGRGSVDVAQEKDKVPSHTL